MVKEKPQEGKTFKKAWQMKTERGQKQESKEWNFKEIKSRKAADVIYHTTAATKAERQMWKTTPVPVSVGDKDGHRLKKGKEIL